MIENILKNTTKIGSQFLEFKCIFYDLYKLGLCCCGTTNNPRIDERTVRENDRSSGKMMNNSGVKMLEMILGASGLQIECGLFQWLSSDVGKLLQVMDVPSMVCVELDPIHGGGGHG